MCREALTYVWFDVFLTLFGLVVGRWWTLLVGPACWLLLLAACGLVAADASWIGQARFAAAFVAIGLATRYVLRVFRRAAPGEAPVSRTALLVVFAAATLGVQLGLHTYLYLVVDRATARSEGPWLTAPMVAFIAVGYGWLAALLARRALGRRPQLGWHLAGRASLYLSAMALILAAVFGFRTGDTGDVLRLISVVLATGTLSSLAAPFLIPLWVGKSMADLAAAVAIGAVAVGPLLLLLLRSDATGSGARTRTAAAPATP